MRHPSVEMAEKALRALAKEDLLFEHHGVLNARPGAYKRLAEFFKEYAASVKGNPDGS